MVTTVCQAGLDFSVSCLGMRIVKFGFRWILRQWIEVASIQHGLVVENGLWEG